MPVVDATLVITNKSGLHARPAAVFVQTAARFQSKIMLRFADKTANAKSIMGVMKLGVSKGDTIVVQVEGEDAEQAIAALKDLVQRNFDEKE